MADHAESKVGLTSRRQFVQAGVCLGTAGVAALGAVDKLLAAEASTAKKSAEPVIRPGDTVLFQGDSITDAGRKRGINDANSVAALGEGYAWFAASQMLVDSPNANLKIFNRGISGHKVPQLDERWQADCLDLKPNVLSILIGVNDYWHKKSYDYKGSAESYEQEYHALVQRTKDALPNVRLVICEPFLLECGNVKPGWVPEFVAYQKAARRVADEAKAVFVPFQSMFDAAVKVAPPTIWAGDGVHPSSSGAALMAHWWLKLVATAP